MNAARFSRLAHRWLALVVGLQLLVWTASGLYMVAVDIDLIHGDPLVRNVAPAWTATSPLAAVAPLRAGRDDIVEIRVRALPDDRRPVYEVVRAGGKEWFDGVTGRPLPALSPERIRTLATAYYAGAGAVSDLRLLRTDAEIPGEIRGRHAPLWRVEFDDALATTLYLDPRSGTLVTRRHALWRAFDFLWSLHIMDYREREDVNNALLRTVTPLALLLVSSGVWVAFYSFAFLQRRRRPRPAP